MIINKFSLYYYENKIVYVQKNFFRIVSPIDCLFMKFHGMRIPIKINIVFHKSCRRLFIVVTYLKHLT